MDAPSPAAPAMRQSKVFSTGFYGYSVLDYKAMSQQVAEQVGALQRLACACVRRTRRLLCIPSRCVGGRRAERLGEDGGGGGGCR